MSESTPNRLNRLNKAVKEFRELPNKWRSVPDIWVNGKPPVVPSHRDCADEVQTILDKYHDPS